MSKRRSRFRCTCRVHHSGGLGRGHFFLYSRRIAFQQALQTVEISKQWQLFPIGCMHFEMRGEGDTAVMAIDSWKTPASVRLGS